MVAGEKYDPPTVTRAPSTTDPYSRILRNTRMYASGMCSAPRHTRSASRSARKANTFTLTLFCSLRLISRCRSRLSFIVVPLARSTWHDEMREWRGRTKVRHVALESAFSGPLRSVTWIIFTRAPRSDDLDLASHVVVDDRLGLDLDEHLGIDEPPHLDHARRRTDGAKCLSMRATDLLPPPDVGHVDPRADDVRQSCAGAREGGFDVSQRLSRLGIRVARANHAPGCVGRRRAGDVDGVADSDCARVANDRLPRRSARDILSHVSVSALARHHVQVHLPDTSGWPCHP